MWYFLRRCDDFANNKLYLLVHQPTTTMHS
uniref:Uncharacterized protein n=1 Tax=Ascaris lumbricoides TaxID=6252 RepID=A0A0M3HK16_ASCLU